MGEQQYEHHITIRRDKLCPFIHRSLKDLHTSVCNWHRNLEIMLVTRGEGRMKYDCDDISIGEHDVIVVNSGALHRPYSDSGVSFNYIIIDEGFCTENGISTSDIVFCRQFKSDAVEKICLEVASRYDRYKKEPAAVNIARLRLSMLTLLLEICENHTESGAERALIRGGAEEYVKKALEYLAEHYTERVALEDVADVCGITKYHLAREFKRYTGQTVFTYINTLRCKKAEVCISQGMTVTEASGESGFESISYFSRTYKRLMGHSPSSEKSKN